MVFLATLHFLSEQSLVNGVHTIHVVTLIITLQEWGHSQACLHAPLELCGHPCVVVSPIHCEVRHEAAPAVVISLVVLLFATGRSTPCVTTECSHMPASCLVSGVGLAQCICVGNCVGMVF